MDPLHKDVELLEPVFRDQVKKLLALLDENRIKYYINETLRDKAIQEAYYLQGREVLEKVNAKRSSVGLWTISEIENRHPVTWTLQSKHMIGEAIDIVPATARGRPNWAAPYSFYKEIGTIALQLGIAWGGTWKNADSPHYERKHI